jgi:6-pyruvoyltetrahydropterin/6-carboxytetrahydropterin synthase
MWKISKEYYFCAAHRLEGHPKCGRLHGHNYVAIVTIYSTALDGLGMVFDYNLLDAAVKPVVDELDHKYIVSISNITGGCPYYAVAKERGDAVAPGIFTSTAENIAEYLAHEIQSFMKKRNVWRANLWSMTVTVKETPKSDATYVED